MGLLRAIGLGGLEDAILGGNDPATQQQYGAPIGPGLLSSPGPNDAYPKPSQAQGTQNYGLLSPQNPASFSQYANDQRSFSGIMNALTGGAPGIGSALSRVFQPDSFAAPGYNAQLAQGQGVETARLNLAPYENAQGVSPAQMKSPLGAPQIAGAPMTPVGSSFSQADASGAFGPALSTSPYQGPGAQFDPSQAPSALRAPNILDPQVIAQQIQFLRQSPAGAAMIPKYMEVLDSMNKLGTGFDANGNQIRLGGANNAGVQTALSNKGIVPPSDATDPNAVNAAVGNNAAATAFGTASGTGQGQLGTAFQLAQMKAAGEGQGKLPTAGPLAAAEAAGKFPYQITSLRPDATAGTPAQLGISPNPGVGNLGTFGPAMGKSSEEVKRGQTLGEQSDTIDKAATASEGLQGRMQFIQRELPKAAVGSFADRKAEVGRMLIGLGISPKTVEASLGNVASADVLQKEFYRLSTDQVKGLGREPGYILDKIASANPNLETQPEAMLLMTNAINQGAQRDLDKRDARDAWLADPKHMRSLSGFEATFNKTNPQDNYVNRAYQATDGVPPTADLIGTKNGNRVWRLQDGSKVMARH